MQNPQTAICPGCGGANRCAIADNFPAQTCWCMQKPAQLPLPAAGSASCYCPACLQKLIRKQPLLWP